MWRGRAQSRRRCGRDEPKPGVDHGGGEPSPGADVVGAGPDSGADVAWRAWAHFPRHGHSIQQNIASRASSARRTRCVQCTTQPLCRRTLRPSSVMPSARFCMTSWRRFTHVPRGVTPPPPPVQPLTPPRYCAIAPREGALCSACCNAVGRLRQRCRRAPPSRCCGEEGAPPSLPAPHAPSPSFIPRVRAADFAQLQHNPLSRQRLRRSIPRARARPRADLARPPSCACVRVPACASVCLRLHVRARVSVCVCIAVARSPTRKSPRWRTASRAPP